MLAASQRIRLSRVIAAVAVAAGLVLGLGTFDLQAGGKKSDSQVKITAVGSKIDADGNQNVLITLDINKGWHAYANPVGNPDLRPSQTVVKVLSKTQKAEIEYPKGKLHEDKTLGDYKVFEGKVAIKAAVKRTAGDTSPLELAVTLQVCNDSTCLLPATVKIAVKQILRRTGSVSDRR
ncbi:MAG: hypothetical protein FJ271_13370 [Planctomycetes bacterium]|nr:hypothetical protein [Planctomycetota bacterium]